MLEGEGGRTRIRRRARRAESGQKVDFVCWHGTPSSMDLEEQCL